MAPMLAGDRVDLRAAVTGTRHVWPATNSHDCYRTVDWRWRPNTARLSDSFIDPSMGIVRDSAARLPSPT